MLRFTRGAIVLGALVLVGATEASSQDVEAVMREREALGLTDDQVAGLDRIRRQTIEERSAEAAEMAELRSQLAAGQIRRSELMAAREDRAAAAEGRADERRSQIDALLTEEQRTQVEQMRRRAGRAQGRPGMAGGGRGFGPDGRGRGGAGGVGPRGDGPRGGPRGGPPGGGPGPNMGRRGFGPR